MRRILFFPPFLSYLLLIILLFAFFKGSTGFKILAALFIVTIAYAFRRANVPYRDTIKNNGEIYLAPVHGIVDSIKRDTLAIDAEVPHHEIRITIGGWDEKGLYLPTAGEVSYLKANKGKKIQRNASNEEFHYPLANLAHTDLILTSKNQTQTLMRFIDCKYGVRPSMWLKSGDRGRGAACFGYYPLGGTLLIYIPQNSDILVFENERLIPGQTVIAAIKDVN
jgi:hypothetical protein